MMSSNYTANQYESAYKPQRLQNWCVSKPCKQRPTALEGHTTFVANDRGHLMPGVAKKGSSWPDFKGTWDLPTRLHPHCINPTSRSVEGLNRLQARRVDPKCTSTTRPQDGSKDTVSPNQVDHDAQEDSAAPTPRCTPSGTNPTPPPPQSQNLPCCIGGEVPARKDVQQQLQKTEGVLEVDAGQRPPSGRRDQCSKAGERPATTGNGSAEERAVGTE